MIKFACSNCDDRYEEYHMTCPSCKQGYSFVPVPVKEELDKVITRELNGTIEKSRVVKMIDFAIKADAHTEAEKNILKVLKTRFYSL